MWTLAYISLFTQMVLLDSTSTRKVLHNVSVQNTQTWSWLEDNFILRQLLSFWNLILFHIGMKTKPLECFHKLELCQNIFFSNQKGQVFDSGLSQKPSCPKLCWNRFDFDWTTYDDEHTFLGKMFRSALLSSLLSISEWFVCYSMVLSF